MDEGMVFEAEEDFNSYVRDAKEESVQWAKLMLERKNWVILDTETTGLGNYDQVVQVGILDPDGTVLLDTLVKATCEIDPRALSVHMISKAKLENAPGFAEVLPKICEIAKRKEFLIYSSNGFDMRMLEQSALAAGLKGEEAYFTWYDAMCQYARFVGEWNEYRGDFKWQKLPGGSHTAIGDCRAVLEVIMRMAGREVKDDLG